MIALVARRPAKTVFEYCVATQGVVKGAKLAGFILSWSIATERLGHPLGEGAGVKAAVQEYATYWADNERTAWNHLRTFRTVFPQWDTPHALVEIAAAKKVDAAAITAQAPAMFALA
jgi:hypothetical protein